MEPNDFVVLSFVKDDPNKYVKLGSSLFKNEESEEPVLATENSYAIATSGDAAENDIISKTNENVKTKPVKSSDEVIEDRAESESMRESLTTKNAVKFLLNGTLKRKVCRYCLCITKPLSELDQILHVAGHNILYKVTIRDMVASFHPVKVADDPNFPNKICNTCLDRTISSYLFAQQCERSERALRNCFDDMFDKLEKLDPLERPKKRGRQKLNPNHNVLYAEHEKVADYAEPIINIINNGAEFADQNINNAFECPKCWQVLPSMESLLNHEKIHPKSMWYHCRICGKSFPKRYHLKKHSHTAHVLGKQLEKTNNDFKCLDCGFMSSDYHQHLQHIEKHKFQTVMQHLVDRKMNDLCAVCFGKGSKLVGLDKMVCLHGGSPELMGERNLYNIIGSSIPDMNILHNYTGNKICEKCLNHAITSYVFIQQTLYTRHRLHVCISDMLENLLKIENPEGKLFVEISQHIIMPLKQEEFDENLLIDKEDEIDESKLKVDVLEDEFRIESDSEDVESKNDSDDKKIDVEEYIAQLKPLEAKSKTSLDNIKLNGIQTNKKSIDRSVDVCSEFLTFKSRKTVKRPYKHKYTCPLCDKNFISDYFFRRHVLKHVLKKIKCTICGCMFNSKFYLHEHIKMDHLMKQVSYFSCKTCGRNFNVRNKLTSHEKCHRTKECQLCDKIFVSQKHYDSHMQRHVLKLRIVKQKRVQNCSFCEKECMNDNELSVHVNKVHLQIKPYSCDMCDKQLYTESNLKSHKEVHSMICKETCNFCSKSFKCRKDLVIHVRKHIGVRPHSCQICCQSFYSQAKVTRHMKIFHGGRFCCKLCKNVFATKNVLKDHVNKVHCII